MASNDLLNKNIDELTSIDTKRIVILPDTLLDNNSKQIISLIIKNFDNYCLINTSKPVNIIQEEKGILKKKSPKQDIPSFINNKSMLRLIPEYDLEIPYNLVKRVITYSDFGFIISTHNVNSIINHEKLSNYDNAKYSLFIEEKYIVWIELTCIQSDYRGNQLFEILLNNLIEYVKQEMLEKNIDTGIIGLDISGTRNEWRNSSLKNYYQKFGFEFNIDDFHLFFAGSQIGYLEIKSND